MSSSPGLCQFSVFGTTNGDVFNYENEKCDPERVEMVKLAVMSRMQMMMQGTVTYDDINVFIKPEPHKVAKIREGRWRLISAVSLIDTMIDRILLGWLTRQALNTVGRTPCLAGWSPMRGGWRYMWHRFGNKPVVCLDKSSWDWTVQPYLVDLWLEFLLELPIGATVEWKHLLRCRFEALFRSPVFQFKDGTRVTQGVCGIMKSGCYLTLLLNSVGQSMAHYLAMIRCSLSPYLCQPVCIGDDTVQEEVPDLEAYVRALQSVGAKIKGAKVRNWVEFAGFAFAKDTCVPAYWRKHLFSLQYGDLALKLESYQYLYANEPVMFRLISDLAAQSHPELAMTLSESRAVFNG